MDLTIRDWMVVAGVLLIVAVLFDAWRRIRRDRSAEVRMKLVDNEELSIAPEEDFSMFGELPNGGARVVDRSDILRATGHGSSFREDGGVVAGMTSITADSDIEDIDWLDGLGSKDASSAVAKEEAGPSNLRSQEAPEVFMFNVVARSKKGFHGGDILHILLACDLRFGDMGFFHRHELEAGRGAVQFSVANMMQPGVFDIDTVSDMATPGLVFFLTLPGPVDMMQAFDYMLETAKTVARNLDADVLDESRSVVSKQTTEHSRQKIRDLELRLLAKAH